MAAVAAHSHLPGEENRDRPSSSSPEGFTGLFILPARASKIPNSTVKREAETHSGSIPQDLIPCAARAMGKNNPRGEKKQQRHQILKKQMSQEKRWREKGPQDILFLAFKSRKKGKKKKKRLNIAAELPENPNVSGKLDLLWLCSAQTEVRLQS